MSFEAANLWDISLNGATKVSARRNSLLPAASVISFSNATRDAFASAVAGKTESVLETAVVNRESVGDISRRDDFLKHRKVSLLVCSGNAFFDMALKEAMRFLDFQISSLDEMLPQIGVLLGLPHYYQGYTHAHHFNPQQWLLCHMGLY